MYLVTGGAGFIGSHLVHRIVAMGERVRVLDNLSSGRLEHLRGLEGRIEFVPGDILDAAILRKAASGVEVVFHQAALGPAAYSLADPVAVSRINAEGTLNVLRAARDAGVKRVVYASSSSVYGQSFVLPNSEQLVPRPVSPYGVSKLAGEHYCRIFTELYGLETISLRYFNVFGPRQQGRPNYESVIPRFIRSALLGDPLQVHGDGLQSRDFTFVENVVDATLKAAHALEGVGEVFNVGQGSARSLLDFIDLLQDVFGKDLPIFHTPARSGDVRHTLADISRAQRCFGYRPLVSFEEGIIRTIAALKRERAGMSLRPAD